MKLICSWLLLLCPFFLIGQSKVHIHIPTVEEETDFVWRTIQDIAFFEKHQYDIMLPEGALMDELKSKARNQSLSHEDYEQLGLFMKSKEYAEANYNKGFQKIEAQLPFINRLLKRLLKEKKNWSFQSFETYTIHLTLYGPGGNYNPNTGTIMMLTTPEGRFKQYDNPSNTIIHEIVHIGMEGSIIQDLKVDHPLKERLVDHYVLHFFEKDLPNYRLQNMGDERMDQYLKKRKDFKNLHFTIKSFMDERK